MSFTIDIAALTWLMVGYGIGALTTAFIYRTRR